MAASGSVTIESNLTDSQVVGLVTIPFSPKLSHSVQFADGAGAKKIERANGMIVTIAGGVADLDLAGGFVDLNGAEVTYTKIKSIVLKAPVGNVAAIVVGAHATAPWAALLNAAGTITLKPGTSFGVATEDANGYAVTATTNDIIHMTGTTGDTCQVAIGGEV